MVSENLGVLILAVRGFFWIIESFFILFPFPAAGMYRAVNQKYHCTGKLGKLRHGLVKSRASRWLQPTAVTTASPNRGTTLGAQLESTAVPWDGLGHRGQVWSQGCRDLLYTAPTAITAAGHQGCPAPP